MYQILVIEDNLADAYLIVEALKGYNASIITMEDGEKAIAYLEKQEYSFGKLPDIIFLDINLPKKSGKEVLKHIKSHDRLKSIPTIILSGSSSLDDINETYRLHANSYITKPLDIEEFFTSVNSIFEYWFTTVKRPVFES